MKFIVDAQIPYGLKLWLIDRGHDALHTDDLPNKHFSSDKEIIEFAEKEQRIIISKDSDFYQHNVVRGVPSRLLIITLGNIINKKLFRLFELNFSKIEKYYETGSKIVEFENSSITVHS
ncbi:MAG: DUF5615 family PIN-like protein [Bacteroidota bacterium]